MKYNYLHLTKKQAVLIALIVVALDLFLCFWEFWERRIEFTSDPSGFITYTGLPFEAVKINNTVALDPGLEWYEGYIKGGVTHPWFEQYKRQQHERYHPSGLDPIMSPLIVSQTREYLWNGITLNTILFAAFSIVTVKLSTRIRDEIEYRRYYKLNSALK